MLNDRTVFLIKALVLSDGYRFAILFTELDDKDRREFI